MDELDAEQRSVEITRSLARLLDVAEALPRDTSPADDDADAVEHPRPRFNHGTVDYYYEVFDPFIWDSLVVGSLTDDLSDIYADLQKGLALLDALRMLRRVNAGNARDISLAIGGPAGAIIGGTIAPSVAYATKAGAKGLLAWNAQRKFNRWLTDVSRAMHDGDITQLP